MAKTNRRVLINLCMQTRSHWLVPMLTSIHFCSDYLTDILVTVRCRRCVLQIFHSFSIILPKLKICYPFLTPCILYFRVILITFGLHSNVHEDTLRGILCFLFIENRHNVLLLITFLNL